MKHRTRAPILAFAGLLAGCAPRVSTLVAHHHYREAVCAAHDGGVHRRQLVADALVRDAALYLHVHRITADELAPRLEPGLAEQVLARVHLVKITVQANTLPLDALQLEISIQGEDMGAAAGPVDWGTLAVATGETVPAGDQRPSYATIGNLMRGLGVVFTGGLSLRYTHFERRTILTPAPLQVYERQMPRSAALLRALGPVRCRGLGLDASAVEGGQVCTGHFVFDRSPATRWSLTLAQTYVATIDPAAMCSLQRSASVEIGRTDEWLTRFGPRMRRLDELPAGPVTTRWERKP